MKIKKIELKDYKLFKGEHIFEFSDKITLIMGPGASGKTTLFNSLKQSITGEIPGVKIELEGSSEKFKKNLDNIFLDEELLRKKADEFKALTAKMNHGTINLLVFISIILERAKHKHDLPLIVEADLFSILGPVYRDLFFQIITALQIQVILFIRIWDGKKDFEFKGDKEYVLEVSHEH